MKLKKLIEDIYHFQAPRGYQYAYAVYDDNTGDKKSQSEQSDGSVVQGQYTFIQPDGIRREVVYTADDLKGYRDIRLHSLINIVFITTLTSFTDF